MGAAQQSGKLQLLHIVRRYGPVGGMERYVWELTRELQLLGHHVTVVCERCHVEKPDGIEVYELGEVASRPRWLAQLRFSGRVTKWLSGNSDIDYLIHSHERTSVHQVTTFHGPPFATIFERPFWYWLSLRVWARLYLELRELNVARAIVPNSQIIKQQLAHYYPQQQTKLTEPIVPGVTPSVVREFRQVPPQGGIVGFVGKEWRRKGLPLAVKIVAQLRQTRPDLELWVVGPDAQEVQHLFSGWDGGYKLLGWCSDNAYLCEMDVLLHPAKAEPYGMVISEAMAARVPVVVSDACGAAAQVKAESGQVVPLSSLVEFWVSVVKTELARTLPPPQFVHDWRQVAEAYVETYQQVGDSSHY